MSNSRTIYLPVSQSGLATGGGINTKNETLNLDYNDEVKIYDINGSTVAETAIIIIKGVFHNILLYGNAIIIGKIINTNRHFVINLYVGDNVRCYSSGDVKNRLPNDPYENDIEDHLEGHFNVIHFKEIFKVIALNKELPQKIKERLLSQYI